MLSRDTILTAFTLLSDEFRTCGALGEVNIAEGAVMVVAFNARTSTKDVDAIFEPSADVRNAAAVVANALELPADWLNDAVKSSRHPPATSTQHRRQDPLNPAHPCLSKQAGDRAKGPVGRGLFSSSATKPRNSSVGMLVR